MTGANGFELLTAECRWCHGQGDVAGPVEQLDFSMSLEQIWQITESARIPCPNCNGTGRRVKRLAAVTAIPRRRALVTRGNLQREVG